ncbi:hypothetical protein MRB53_037874 [Persea americana]|nr:hypothetical protein MRB53_037874 [Persea americana]
MEGFGRFRLLPAEIRIMIWRMCDSDALIEASDSLRRDAMVHVYSTRSVKFRLDAGSSPWCVEGGLPPSIDFHTRGADSVEYQSLYLIKPSWLTFDSPDRPRMQQMLDVPLWACRSVKVEIVKTRRADAFPVLFNAVVWLVELLQRNGRLRDLCITWISRGREESDSDGGYTDHMFGSESDDPDPNADTFYLTRHSSIPCLPCYNSDDNADAVVLFKIFRRLRFVHDMKFEFEDEFAECDLCYNLVEVQDHVWSETPFGLGPEDDAIKHEERMWTSYLDMYADRHFSQPYSSTFVTERFAQWTEGYERTTELRLAGLQDANGARPSWHQEAVKLSLLRHLAAHAYNPRGRWWQQMQDLLPSKHGFLYKGQTVRWAQYLLVRSSRAQRAGGTRGLGLRGVDQAHGADAARTADQNTEWAGVPAGYAKLRHHVS